MNKGETMSREALLIDYEYCSGCRSCELACRNEHDIPEGCWGIRVREEEPWKLPDGAWNWDYIPVPTSLCDLCADRRSQGLEAMCVQSCQAKVIEVVPFAEIAERMEALGPRTVVFRPEGRGGRRDRLDEAQGAEGEAPWAGYLL